MIIPRILKVEIITKKAPVYRQMLFVLKLPFGIKCCEKRKINESKSKIDKAIDKRGTAQAVGKFGYIPCYD